MQTTTQAVYHDEFNESAYRVSYSKDGSVEKAKLTEPVLFLRAALAEAARHTKGNRSVVIHYCDAGAYCTENAGKWYLKKIVK